MPHKDIIVYFKPGRRISNFFRVTDKTPFDLQSHVVYQYKCDKCQLIYIGKTACHLRHRIAEHDAVSHLTGNPVSSQVHSNIRAHCLHCTGSSCAINQFKILTRGSSELELLVKESLLIKRLRPQLNGNTGSFELLLA